MTPGVRVSGAPNRRPQHGRSPTHRPRHQDERRETPTRLTADDVMTAPEVADLLHAPVSTVEDWARRGVLPSRKVGRRRLYIRQHVEAMLLSEPETQPSP